MSRDGGTASGAAAPERPGSEGSLVLSGGGGVGTEPSVPPGRVRDAVPTRARTALSVALLAVLYLWVFPYHAQVNNPNENVRVYMTVAIVDDHTFAIDRVERDWGYVNDKATRNGKLYSSKAPGTSYLGVPAYWLLTRLTGRDSRPLTSERIAAHARPPLDRTVIVYVLRLWSNVLPALVFAWFWHRFLGRYTRVPALREAVFFSTMVGSLLFAYSEMFASHAHNAFATMGALMALQTVRERDREAIAMGAQPRIRAGLMFLAGLLGAAATMFEYPAALATFGVALLILATMVERRWWMALLAVALSVVAIKVVLSGNKKVALGFLVLAVASYSLTLTWRGVVRLVAAGLGGAIPTALTLFYHQRCFGDPFKPGYSYLENPQFHAETSQGFFGATRFSWEAALRLWFDPAFGLVPSTVIVLAAIFGMGSFFAWRFPKRVGTYVRAVLLVVVVVLAFKTGQALLAVKAGGWQSPATEQLSYLAYLVLALVALAAISLPPPVRSDLAFGATMFLICYALTRLIGMMNNWRGGWVVGPRYLATLVPLMGLFALVGLDAFAHGSLVRKRIATVFAGGATVHAMVVSGLPSAYFPHIPTEFVSPIFELFLPLLRAGYVPHNAGRYLFHWEGMKGMIPFFVVAGVVAWIVLRGEERRPVSALAHAMAGAAVTFVLLTPFAAVARYDSMGVTRWAMGIWEPRPVVTGPSVPDSKRDTPEALRERGRHLAKTGDAAAALEAFRRAAAMAR